VEDGTRDPCPLAQIGNQINTENGEDALASAVPGGLSFSAGASMTVRVFPRGDNDADINVSRYDAGVHGVHEEEPMKIVACQASEDNKGRARSEVTLGGMHVEPSGTEDFYCAACS
jgi:hypothetical protein